MGCSMRTGYRRFKPIDLVTEPPVQNLRVYFTTVTHLLGSMCTHVRWPPWCFWWYLSVYLTNSPGTSSSARGCHDSWREWGLKGMALVFAGAVDGTREEIEALTQPLEAMTKVPQDATVVLINSHSQQCLSTWPPHYIGPYKSWVVNPDNWIEHSQLNTHVWTSTRPMGSPCQHSSHVSKLRCITQG